MVRFHFGTMTGETMVCVLCLLCVEEVHGKQQQQPVDD